MQKTIEVELIQELLDLQQKKSPYLDEHWEKADLERYQSPEIFDRERERIARTLPQIAAHHSALPEPGAFLTLQMAGRPLLLARDEAGVVRAFYNVCRHRGSRLVSDPSGCQHRFRCPYHAWTWNNSGELIGVPHQKTGFPDLNREEFGLHALPCQEQAGWIWVSLDTSTPLNIDQHLGGLEEEFSGLGADRHTVFDTTTLTINANWKLLVEGGIESYHFRVAHKDTIADLFCDNLSTYRCFGRHMRSVLPRKTLSDLAALPGDQWDLRKHANLLYSLFPGSQFLVQEDHLVWIQSEPLAPDSTRLRIATLVPAQSDTAERQEYWARHHRFTITTLHEDFALAEGIQSGLDSGANAHLNFGRFEGALAKFNQFVAEAIA